MSLSKEDMYKLVSHSSNTCVCSYLTRFTLSCSGGIYETNPCEYYCGPNGHCMLYAMRMNALK